MSLPNERALLRYIMQQKLLRQKGHLDAALRPSGAPQSAPEDGNVQMTETRIYVG